MSVQKESQSIVWYNRTPSASIYQALIWLLSTRTPVASLKNYQFPLRKPIPPPRALISPRHEYCLFKWLHKYTGDLQGGLLWFGEVYFKVYFHMMFGLLIRRVRVQDCTGSNSKLWRNFALGLLSLTKTKTKTIKTMFITLNNIIKLNILKLK